MNTESRAALAAIAFLTRVPVPVALDGDDVRRAGAYLPLVGALLGAVGARFGVVGPVLLTGALHLDALGDTADACGGTTRERSLEIMRDPRIGSFGVAAIVLDLLVKRDALARCSGREAVAAGALSRAVPVTLAAALPYARAEAGTGQALARVSGRRATAAGGLALLVASLALRSDAPRWAIAASTVAAASGVACRRWLGGVTGDTLGASLELTETVLLWLGARR